MDPYLVILSASVLVILSYLFHLFAKKTNVPTVLLLLLLGIIAKQVLPVTIGNLHNYLSVLGNVGLILIVLEAALDLHLENEKKGLILKAFLSALFGLCLTTAAISTVFVFMFSTSWMKAALFAIPFSVISSAIVIPSVSSLLNPEKEFTIYESSISDILGIIFFYLFLDLNHSTSVFSIISTTFLSLVATIIFAVVGSYGLIWVFGRIKEKTKLFLILFSLIFLFAAGKLFHLSSLIIIMIFGLMLGNQHVFFKGFLNKFLNRKQSEQTAGELHNITLESAFVIKTFFFFLFGFSIHFNTLVDLKGVITGVLILALTYPLRYGIIRMLKIKNANDKLLTTINPRGLISILLFFSIPETVVITGLGDASMLIMILSTNLVLTFGLVRYRKRRISEMKNDLQESTEFSNLPVESDIETDFSQPEK